MTKAALKGISMWSRQALGFACLFAASFEACAQTALPPEIAAPGNALVTVQAAGAQVYECKAGPDGSLAWQFREPIATLISNGTTVGRHYAGPTWELTDGSAVTAKVAGRAPGASADDIPWLKLDVTLTATEGKLSGVSTVQRINTKGGVASGECKQAGSLLSVPYTADYIFLKK